MKANVQYSFDREADARYLSSAIRPRTPSRKRSAATSSFTATASLERWWRSRFSPGTPRGQTWPAVPLTGTDKIATEPDRQHPKPYKRMAIATTT
jgi:hypothetical protein